MEARDSRSRNNREFRVPFREATCADSRVQAPLDTEGLGTSFRFGKLAAETRDIMGGRDYTGSRRYAPEEELK